jgi:hypothetical protein
MPPERKAPKGTSLIKRMRTASRNRSMISYCRAYSAASPFTLSFCW